MPRRLPRDAAERLSMGGSCRHDEEGAADQAQVPTIRLQVKDIHTSKAGT